MSEVIRLPSIDDLERVGARNTVQYFFKQAPKSGAAEGDIQENEEGADVVDLNFEMKAGPGWLPPRRGRRKSSAHQQ